MRVLHVTQPTDGGVAQFVRLAAIDQLAHAFEVTVACPPRGSLPDELRDAGVSVRSWRAERSPGMRVVGETVDLAHIIRAERPEVLHLHSSKAGLAGRLAAGRRRVVFQTHGWSFHAAPGLLSWPSLQWERIAARRAHAIVCVSEGERAEGVSAGVRGSWAVIPNGVDTARFPVADGRSRQLAREELGLAEAPLVVCVGRLCEQKGQDMLLALWPTVRQHVRDARLVLVGDGPSKERLLRAAPDGVVFAGHQGNPYPWFVAADVVAFPSRWEGLSLALLEAMAVGRSVVATDVAGAHEALGLEAPGVVRSCGWQFAHRLVERLSCPELANAEGLLARDRVERMFQLSSCLRAIRQLYCAVHQARSQP